jgi:LacI family transcriptional regulator
MRLGMKPERARTVTIRDVAREARVSVASASRALSGAENVTEAMRERVLGAARQLRYVPHSGARFLSTRRTDTLGVILPDLYGEFFSEIIRGADLAARERGLHLLLSSSHADADAVAGAIRSMRGRVDGLLVMSPHVDAEVLAGSLADDLPMVLLNTEVEGGRHPCFRVDNHAGASAVVRHLAERAQCVAHIAGPLDNSEAQARMRGWRDALGEAAGPMLPGDFTEESGWRAGEAIARMDPRPDAVFAANDMMAVGCLTALAEAGIAVPGEVIVAGFDDIPIARLIRPSLTTVSARIADLSRRALERLVRLVEEPDVLEDPLETVHPEVVVRESSSPPTRSTSPAQTEARNPGRRPE